MALLSAHASREAQLAQELQQQARHAGANGAGEVGANQRSDRLCWAG